MNPRAILFDWDNTLVDNWAAIHGALNATLAAFGQPTWSLAETMGRVRESMRDSFPRLFGERWTEARDHFYAGFRAGHLNGLDKKPSAQSLLDLCADRRIPIAIVSNKNGALLRAEVAHLDWTRHFAVIIGAGDATRDKPDAAPALAALDAMTLRPSADIWFVGDTETDVDCATAAGLSPWLVAGTPDVPPRPEARPIADLREFISHLRQMTH